MITTQGILTSDAVTRTGTKFNLATLHRGLMESWRHGWPSLISHDAHWPIGWVHPKGICLEPSRASLVGVTVIPDEPGEWEHLGKAYQSHVLDRTQQATQAALPDLRRALGDAIDGHERTYLLEGVALVGDGLARRAFKSIFSKEDSDGLVPLVSLDPILPGVYRVGDLLAFAHPYFRRSLSRHNNPNMDVLERLEETARLEGVDARIRLDPNAVGLAQTALRPIELEYWYGPKFSDDLPTIPTGVTRHEADAEQREFYGISATEFWWQSRRDDGRKGMAHILEAEELRDIRTFGGPDIMYGCRYVHSVVDEESGRIEHLDGAIRSYSEEAMIERLDKRISSAGRNTEYTKLWRVDGALPLSQWKALVYHYFRGNPLVGEYLGIDEAASEEKKADRKSNSHPSSCVEALVPFSMSPGEGIRLLVSYHELPETSIDAERFIVPLETIGDGEAAESVVDDDIVEIKKLLQRSGHELSLPDPVARMSFRDHYHTFPLILHRTEASTGDTLRAFETLLASWNDRKEDRVVALSVGLITKDCEIRLSMLGHIVDLARWLGRTDVFPPESLTSHTDWLETAYRELSEAGAKPDHSKLISMLTPTSTFRISRSLIAPEMIKVFRREKDAEPECVLVFSDSEVPLKDAVADGQLAPRPSFVIRETRCTGCGREYWTCPCSRFVDEGVAEYCEDGEPAYFFWTDRPE